MEDMAKESDSDVMYSVILADAKASDPIKYSSENWTLVGDLGFALVRVLTSCLRNNLTTAQPTR